MAPRYGEADAREAIANSRSYAETLRTLGMCPTGGAGRILKKWIAIWGISVEHFDPRAAASGKRVGNGRIPLAEVLVEASQFRRTHLKERLFDEGLKRRRCKLCGLGEIWQRHRISLILDHVNGVRDDNRLENLRIVCPNCAATLATHCGRNKPLPEPRACVRCGTLFKPRYSTHRHCSRYCGSRHDRSQFGAGRPVETAQGSKAA